MKIFDSHCHLQDERIFNDIDSIMDRADSAGVCGILCCGSSEKDWDAVIEISRRFSWVVPAFGVHPWYIGSRSEKWLEKLESLLKSVPQAVVGEIGLDHTLKKGDRPEQLRVFEDQLKLAAKLDRPVSIHCRKAWGDLLELLEKQKGVGQGGAIHCWSGAPQLVAQIQRLGLSISFSGSLTNINNRKVRESLVQVDPGRLLVESDSPDIIPRGYSGYNEPANIISIVDEAALLLGWSGEAVSEMTFENGSRLFQR